MYDGEMVQWTELSCDGDIRSESVRSPWDLACETRIIRAEWCSGGWTFWARSIWDSTWVRIPPTQELCQKAQREWEKQRRIEAVEPLIRRSRPRAARTVRPRRQLEMGRRQLPSPKCLAARKGGPHACTVRGTWLVCRSARVHRARDRLPSLVKARQAADRQAVGAEELASEGHQEGDGDPPSEISTLPNGIAKR